MIVLCAKISKLVGQLEKEGGGLRFFVQSDLVKEHLEAKFGGIENFAEEWGAKLPTDSGSGRQSRSVKTIYKWLASGMPNNEAAFFSFFGALDADPIAFVDFERSKFHKNFGLLRQAAMLGGMNIGGFRPLLYLLRPSPQWPENALVKQHYGKVWSTWDFQHDAVETKNVEVTVRVTGDGDNVWPRAYHISYRRVANSDGLWRPFGTILTRGKEAILLQENGARQRIELTAGSARRIDFKTFFGPSPAEFRLASLHHFSAQLDLYDDPSVELRFAG